MLACRRGMVPAVQEQGKWLLSNWDLKTPNFPTHTETNMHLLQSFLKNFSKTFCKRLHRSQGTPWWCTAVSWSYCEAGKQPTSQQHQTQGTKSAVIMTVPTACPLYENGSCLVIMLSVIMRTSLMVKVCFPVMWHYVTRQPGQLDLKNICISQYSQILISVWDWDLDKYLGNLGKGEP